mmetsp:Transcript_21462/g.55775  ORF Transcript_21462/g.55775 Transcript_21462/m.55775 type:complete len:96 (+) Transcript_21462:297-584(+)
MCTSCDALTQFISVSLSCTIASASSDMSSMELPFEYLSYLIKRARVSESRWRGKGETRKEMQRLLPPTHFNKQFPGFLYLLPPPSCYHHHRCQQQ